MRNGRGVRGEGEEGLGLTGAADRSQIIRKQKTQTERSVTKRCRGRCPDRAIVKYIDGASTRRPEGVSVTGSMRDNRA